MARKASKIVLVVALCFSESHAFAPSVGRTRELQSAPLRYSLSIKPYLEHSTVGNQRRAPHKPRTNKPSKLVTASAFVVSALLLRPMKAVAGGGGMKITAPTTPLEK